MVSTRKQGGRFRSRSRSYKKKSSGRKTSRGHQQSTWGKISPLLNVSSQGEMADFTKLIKKGPITIVMVFADWCGHCHRALPIFKSAAKNSGRSVQAVALNETMMNEANSAIQKSVNQNAKSINVDAYPTTLIMDQQGNVVTEVTTPTNEQEAVNLFKKTGPIAVESGLATENVSPLVLSAMKNTSGVVPVNTVNRSGKMSMNAPINQVIEDDDYDLGSPTNMANYQPEMDEYASPTTKNIDLGEYKLKGSPMRHHISPPTNEGDIIQSPLPPNQKVRGGSLYQAMSQTAYQLAPAAILLATAAKVMKRKTRKHHKGRRH